MQLHTLQKSSGTKKANRVGRGGKRGKTSGKGHKGQKSRAGRKIRPAERDMIKKIPKRRGYGKNRARTVHSGRVKPEGVNLAVLERVFENGERVSPQELVARHVVRKAAARHPKVKILGTGTLTKKLTIVDCEISAAAKAAVEKVGGEVL
jgi:large subunit ribosomal protein L15